MEGIVGMKNFRRYITGSLVKRLNPLSFPLWNHRGVSLVIALLILLVLTLIGISAISTTTFETNIAGNERLYNNAFYSSDAGVDYFYGTSNAYLFLLKTTGTIDSKAAGLDLGGGRFNLTWRKINEDTGPPKKVEFMVTSEGVFPNIPTAGRVIIEALIEAVEQVATVGDPQGGDT
jgi:hypothetical protein